MNIQLNRVLITRHEYGPAKGQLNGSIEFTGPHGKVELPLDEQMSKEIVAACADALVRSSRAVAENITADIINDVPALTASDEGEQ